MKREESGGRAVKRRRMIGVVVVLMVAGLLWDFLRVEYGVGVDSVRWLPHEARDITYARVDFTARKAEFTIEREAFEKWCANRRTPLKELGSGGYHVVHRCLPILERRGVLPAASALDEMQGDARRAERAVKQFAAGDLFYEERWANGGGYAIGYDVREKRGYYEYRHH